MWREGSSGGARNARSGPYTIGDPPGAPGADDTSARCVGPRSPGVRARWSSSLGPCRGEGVRRVLSVEHRDLEMPRALVADRPRRDPVRGLETSRTCSRSVTEASNSPVPTHTSAPLGADARCPLAQTARQFVGEHQSFSRSPVRPDAPRLPDGDEVCEGWIRQGGGGRERAEHCREEDGDVSRSSAHRPEMRPPRRVPVQRMVSARTGRSLLPIVSTTPSSLDRAKAHTCLSVTTAPPRARDERAVWRWRSAMPTMATGRQRRRLVRRAVRPGRARSDQVHTLHGVDDSPGVVPADRDQIAEAQPGARGGRLGCRARSGAHRAGR